MPASITKMQWASYVLTFVVYASLLNWKVALVLMVGVGFHEYGHLFAAHKLGLRTAGFFLIPGMGGLAIVRDPYRTFYHKVVIALAGPVAGTLLATVCYGMFYTTHVPFWGSAAMWMFYLNAFNLIPLAMLDGGQVGESIAYSINETAGMLFIGITTVIGAIVVGYFNIFLSLIILYMSGKNFLNHYQAWSLKKKGFGDLVSALPTKLNAKEMVLSIAMYLGVVLGIGILSYCTYDSSIGLSDLFRK